MNRALQDEMKPRHVDARGVGAVRGAGPRARSSELRTVRSHCLPTPPRAEPARIDPRGIHPTRLLLPPPHSDGLRRERSQKAVARVASVRLRSLVEDGVREGVDTSAVVSGYGPTTSRPRGFVPPPDGELLVPLIMVCAALVLSMAALVGALS